MTFYSQHGQDKFLDEKVFRKKEGGTFIDIGANDGVTFSNTFFLEQQRGWTGICIEPHPLAYEKLRKIRKAHTINACVADGGTNNRFMKIEGYGEMLSGLLEKYDKRHLERIESDMAIHGGSKEIIEVQCIRLDELIKKYALTEIDYCTVDTEGGELDILATADLKRNKISVISIENNYDDDSIRKYMRSQDYRKIAKVGVDEFYRKWKRSFWFFDGH